MAGQCLRHIADELANLDWQVVAVDVLRGAYRYSPVPIIPGLQLTLVPFVNAAAYGDGQGQSLLGLSGGPVLTLGHFNRPLFDYTKLPLLAVPRRKHCDSPFAFDRYVDTATLVLV